METYLNTLFEKTPENLLDMPAPSDIDGLLLWVGKLGFFETIGMYFNEIGAYGDAIGAHDQGKLRDSITEEEARQLLRKVRLAVAKATIAELEGTQTRDGTGNA